MDPVNPSGHVRPLSQVNKGQNHDKKTSGGKDGASLAQESSAAAAQTDKISISSEALSLAQAQEAAQRTKDILSKQSDAVLSNDENRLNALI